MFACISCAIRYIHLICVTTLGTKIEALGESYVYIHFDLRQEQAEAATPTPQQCKCSPSQEPVWRLSTSARFSAASGHIGGSLTVDCLKTLDDRAPGAACASSPKAQLCSFSSSLLIWWCDLWKPRPRAQRQINLGRQERH